MHIQLRDLTFKHIQGSWKGEVVQGGHFRDQETLIVVVEVFLLVIAIIASAIALVVVAVKADVVCTYWSWASQTSPLKYPTSFYLLPYTYTYYITDRPHMHTQLITFITPHAYTIKRSDLNIYKASERGRGYKEAMYEIRRCWQL